MMTFYMEYIILLDLNTLKYIVIYLDLIMKNGYYSL